MLNIILFFLLILGFFIGLRRGFILQIVHLAGFIISFIVAYLYFDQLSPYLKLWIPYPDLVEEGSLSIFLGSIDLEASYYRAIAFAILFFSTKLLMQLVGSMLDFLADLPLIKQFNGLLGGFLGFVEVYLVIFILLYIGALVPIEFVQNSLRNSSLAISIVENTPIFSKQIQELWFEYVS